MDVRRTTPLSRVGRYAGSRLAETNLALATVPATTLVVALRRRARRKASNQAWRYRTHHEASADSARMVSSAYQDDLSAQAESFRQEEQRSQ
ncbi:MAG TPA: hypothetical protein VHZ96_10610 [Frankiaceae bacterium]|jgi:hypothetical protein|nr:hypothetical protein [Frankiaceae bacterium]